jgi:hypothetical protein
MKNIHVLPTDKPSRLISSGKEFNLLQKSTIDKRCKNIYITSDEEIKEGDWCLDIKRNMIFQSKRNEIGTSKKIPIIICTYEGCYIKKDCKKIILTTDQDLIKDGVQDINDEFLEWFVQNPSCEWVEVVKYDGYLHFKYMIIIPQEEPKPIHKFNNGRGATLCGKCHVIISEGITEELYCEKCKPKQEIKLEDIFNDEKKQGVKDLIDAHKQETIEEAAERLAKIHCDVRVNTNTTEFQIQQLIIKGAKWQQKRMYSEEEVLELLLKSKIETSNLYYEDMKEWFKQFKKK